MKENNDKPNEEPKTIAEKVIQNINDLPSDEEASEEQEPEKSYSEKKHEERLEKLDAQYYDTTDKGSQKVEEDNVIRLAYDHIENKPKFDNQEAANWAIRVYNDGMKEVDRSMKHYEFVIADGLAETVQKLTGKELYRPTDEQIIRYIAGVIIEVSEEADPEESNDDDTIPVYIKTEAELNPEELEQWEKQKPEGFGITDEKDTQKYLDEDGNLV